MTNKLILGTVQLGLDYGVNNQHGRPSLKLALEILDKAYDSGIRTLDTAEAYGNSQKVIGTFHKRNPTKIFKVISKLNAKNTINTSLSEKINENINTLGVKVLEGYMFHNYSSLKNNPYLFNEALKAKKEGIIKKIGVSLYTNDEIEDIIKNYKTIDFIQAPFNLLDNQQKRKKAFESLKAENIEIHTRSVFLQGLFFSSQKTRNKQTGQLESYLNELDNIKKQYSLSTEKLALQYALQKDYIDYVLIGVETTQQLLQNIAICNNKSHIPHEAVDSINVMESELLNPTNWN